MDNFEQLEQEIEAFRERLSRMSEASIRINERYRICFTWTEAGPAEVEIVDYH